MSFSGIDGAGKSTQIERLCARLSLEGFSFRLVSFWDDVATFVQLRDATGHAVFGGDRGVGTPGSPVNRRDKNVRSWMMTGLRLFLYCADAISLRLFIRKTRSFNVDVLLFDRYIDDELANLPPQNPLARLYVRAVAGFVPKPDARFLLDADPVLARARKPEYPIEFLHDNRNAYFALGELIGGFTLIAPTSIEDAERQVARHALNVLTPPSDCGAQNFAGPLAEEVIEHAKNAPEFGPSHTGTVSY